MVSAAICAVLDWPRRSLELPPIMNRCFGKPVVDLTGNDREGA